MKTTKRNKGNKSSAQTIVKKKVPSTNGVTVQETELPEENPFKIEFDPSVESMIRGKNRHLVDALVDTMEKLVVGEGHVKIVRSKTIITKGDASSLYNSAKRAFEANPRNKHFFKVAYREDAKKNFSMAVITRVA